MSKSRVWIDIIIKYMYFIRINCKGKSGGWLEMGLEMFGVLIIYGIYIVL